MEWWKGFFMWLAGFCFGGISLYYGLLVATDHFEVQQMGALLGDEYVLEEGKHWALEEMDGRCLRGTHDDCKVTVPTLAKLLLSYYPDEDKYVLRCISYKYYEERGISATYIPTLGRGQMEWKWEPQGDRHDKTYAADWLDQIRNLTREAPECMTKIHLTLDDYSFTGGNYDPNLLRKLVNASRKQGW
jgi:hypothetical protein